MPEGTDRSQPPRNAIAPSLAPAVPVAAWRCVRRRRWTAAAAALAFTAAVPALRCQPLPEDLRIEELTPQQYEQAIRDQEVIGQAYAAYRRGDHPGAARLYERLARSGNRLAQFNLAVMHVRGEVPDPSKETALLLLRVAAARGLAQAMYALGESYESGLLTPQNLAESTQWYERAAELGQTDAAVSAGTAYYLGRGARHDYAVAAKYYLQAARGGDAGAQYLYASMCENGVGIARDLRLARYWYEIAARNGEIGAAVKARELAGR